MEITGAVVLAVDVQHLRRHPRRDLMVHPWYFPWENMFGISYAALLHSLDEIAVLQMEHEVRIGIVNIGSWGCLHFRQPDLLPELERRDIGFVLDVGHARLNHALGTFAKKAGPATSISTTTAGQTTTMQPAGPARSILPNSFRSCWHPRPGLSSVRILRHTRRALSTCQQSKIRHTGSPTGGDQPPDQAPEWSVGNIGENTPKLGSFSGFWIPASPRTTSKTLFSSSRGKKAKISPRLPKFA